MEFTNFERKLIARRIRKTRRLSFKRRAAIWNIISITFLVLIPLCYFFKDMKHVVIVLFLWLISYSLGSIDYLCNIIKKYDDKLKIDISDNK